MGEQLETITLTLLPNERAYCLVELNLTPWKATKGGNKFQPMSWRGVRRWQIVTVNRGDRLTSAVRDLGPASRFKCQPFRIFSFWEDTVAELQGQADHWREYGDPDMDDFVINKQGESTLIKDFFEQQEEGKKQARNQTTIGPYMRRQRDAVSQAAIKELIHGK